MCFLLVGGVGRLFSIGFGAGTSVFVRICSFVQIVGVFCIGFGVRTCLFLWKSCLHRIGGLDLCFEFIWFRELDYHLVLKLEQVLFCLLGFFNLVSVIDKTTHI